MTFIEFIGCSMIAFGPSLAIFCSVIAKDPIRIIILISASFFWLVSLLLSSILWAIVVPLKDFLIFGVTFAIIFQELFRFLFYKVLRKAEIGLQKVAEVGNNIAEPRPKFYNNRAQLSFVSGVGFGLMSGTFSIINILANATGPGTVGINGDSPYFFLCSALTTSAFIILNICWTVILFYSCDKRQIPLIFFVLLTHLIASYITFLNPEKRYLISISLEYLLLLITSLVALKCAGFRFDRLKFNHQNPSNRRNE
ncbi:hypothetical protein SSS_05992 [Sarcoptes scabiei]|uniref:Gamma-secretase subunit APH-1A n=1 Tax=Sarcoptes scabiei TaxID=52283 RepID=A0A834R6N3_SARSC|nr:hypothetical protein SSS_05992 [Sarcoptes scabiei]